MANRINTITGERIIAVGKQFLSLLVMLYLLFMVGRSVYGNFQMQQKIMEIEDDIEKLRRDTARLNSLITYYQTETFRDLEARSKLGLKKPGEIVLAVPENADDPTLERRPAEIPKKEETPTPNYIKWWEYLFGKTT